MSVPQVLFNKSFNLVTKLSLHSTVKAYRLIINNVRSPTDKLLSSQIVLQGRLYHDNHYTNA